MKHQNKVVGKIGEGLNEIVSCRALTKAEVQKRHRYYKKMAIKFMEKQLNVTVKEVMDVFKWHDIQRDK